MAYQIVNEEKNRRWSLLITIGFHTVLLISFFLFFKWTPPDPPLPDYGVELNFGTDPEGYGEVQSLSSASESKNEEESSPTQVNEQEQADKIQDKENIPTADETPDPITTEEESPVAIPEVKTEKPKTKIEPTEVKPEPVKKAVVSKPEVKSENTGKGSGGAGTSDKPAGNNNGDRPGKVGDQGDPKGSLDSRNLYGPKGSGGGASLDMAGWIWDSPPNKRDPSAEDGKIVFEVTVDDQGSIIGVKTIEKTVSPRVEQFYKEQVENLEFNKTRDNVSSAPQSKGKITIVVRSN